jgi:hypothetical protein
MMFSNRLCDPNIGIQGQIVLVVMRDIQPGEGLTHDWATTDDDTYEMKCNCGAHHCRGVITGQDWRRKDLQEKYRGYMARYLQREIDRGEGIGAPSLPDMHSCLPRGAGRRNSAWRTGGKRSSTPIICVSGKA